MVLDPMADAGLLARGYLPYIWQAFYQDDM